MCGCDEKRIYTSEMAPKAIGPYSPAVKAGGMVFISGQIGLDPATGAMVEGGIEAETRRVLTNLKNLLAAAGASMDEVVKTTVYLRDMSDFAAMNAVYAQFFVVNPPARVTVAVSGLPRNAAVEIDAMAVLTGSDCSCDCGCGCGSECTCGCQSGGECKCGTSSGKKCNCGPECTCGCQSGGECTCGSK